MQARVDLRAPLLATMFFVAAGCPRPAAVLSCRDDSSCADDQVCVERRCVVPDPLGEGEGEEGEGEEGEGEVAACDDNDNDGYGVGAACLGPDCDDGAIDAFILYPGVFADRDGDGVTAPAAVDLCAGATLPGTHRVSPTRGPVVITWAGSASSSAFGRDWEDPFGAVIDDFDTAAVDMDDVPSAPLRLADFVCTSVPEVVERIEVRLRGGWEDQDLIDLPASFTATISLPGLVPITLEDTRAWSGASFQDVVFGIDVNNVSPELLCGGELVAELFAGPSNDNDRFEVDAFELLVRGGSDCDDDTPQAVTPASLFVDFDEDFQGEAGSPLVATCLSEPRVPRGLAARDFDCADSDPQAFAFSSTFYGTPVNGGGGYDYNCDGTEEHQTIFTDDSCVDDGLGGCVVSSSIVSGQCGDTVPLQSCSGIAPCSLNPSSTTQRCR